MKGKRGSRKMGSKNGNSHFYFSLNNYLLKSKRSQITIFIIIALLIVGVLIFAFYSQIKDLLLPKTPEQLIPKQCIADIVKKGLNETMKLGGTLKPELYFLYNNETIDYLCYTNEWYKTCVMQKPLLKQEIEAEIEVYSEKTIRDCITNMENKLKSKGYSVKTTGSKESNVNIEPEKVVVEMNMTMTIEREEEKLIFESNRFTTEFSSNSYEIIMVASSIQNYEARYGDSTPESYMAFYPDLKVEKKKQSDGTKVYIITDRNTGEKLQFATRSLAWPPGYALPVS
jgi:hypothetical protein